MLYWALDRDSEASSRELALALELGPSDPEAQIQAALLGVVEDRERAFAHEHLPSSGAPRRSSEVSGGAGLA